MDNLKIELTRTVRFCVDLGGPAESNPPSGGRHNTFAGWPSMAGIGAYYELEVVCRGQADPITGYLLNISSIDTAARDLALPLIARRVRAGHTGGPLSVLAELMSALQRALGDSVWSVRWRLSPYYWVAMDSNAPDRALIAQQFEFSASHRLHVDSISEAENRRLFGKCNHPSGHGHNYRVEPVVSVPLDGAARGGGSGGGLTLPELEQIVDQTIIKRFDHKHLNADTAEFARLNPSVENIARVCHDLLAGPIAQAGGRLEQVTVWETEKTRCTYPAK